MTPLLLLLLTITYSAYAACPNGLRVRKEVRTLTPTEWSTLSSAFYDARNATRPDMYDYLVNIHNRYNLDIHTRAMFLPWHRRQLYEVERQLRKVSPNVTLPYWAWSYDSQAPEQSIVLSDRFYGGNGDYNNGYCLYNGPFVNFYAYYPRSGACLTRGYNRGNRLGALAPPEAINRIVMRNGYYDAFREDLEVNAHNAVHSNIGQMFSTMFAPNDPLFYAHHAYIDKIWFDWQNAHPRSFYEYYGTNGDGSSARLTDTMPGFPDPVRVVMNATNLCYTYADFRGESVPFEAVPTTLKASPEQKPVVVDGGDRLELVSLRIPDPLPQKYLIARGFNVQRVRALEKKQAEAIQAINKINGYVSSAALVKQPKLLKGLLATDRPVQQAVEKLLGTGPSVQDRLKAWLATAAGKAAVLPESEWKDKLEGIIGKSA